MNELDVDVDDGQPAAAVAVAPDVASPMIVRPRMRIPSWPMNVTIDTYLIIYADDNNSNHDECIILEQRRREMRECTSMST